MSTASIRETFLRKMSVLPADYYPKVLRYIETLEEADDAYDEENYAEWLRLNPPIPIEEDPTISPEHLARLRQRFKDVDEGKTKGISFTPEELKEFWQEIRHSPDEAIAKAESRAYYRIPKNRS
jgi:hypothetical protein